MPCGMYGKSEEPQTTTRWPCVPEAATSRRAIARLGAVQRPSRLGWERVGAVALEAEQSGQDCLAVGRGDLRAAVQVDNYASVDGVAERAPYAYVVEGRLRVHVDRVDREYRVCV